MITEKCFQRAVSLSDAFEYELALKFLIKGRGLGVLSNSNSNPHLPSLQLFASINLELGDIPAAIQVRFYFNLGL